MEAVLGIDTSCYTTSVALVSGGEIRISARKLLSVDAGARGLRQSDAFFQHVTRLPALFEQVRKSAGDMRIRAVCASARPRSVEGSYMPVFLAGRAFGESIASVLNVPFYETSHQQGHVRAAMVGANPPKDSFIALHLSGGTTESLLVFPGLLIEKIGGSSDLHAGQFVDRVGVKMGLSFPAGPGLENLARAGNAQSVMPLAGRDGEISFSGAEAQAMRMLEQGARREDVAAEVYSYIARAVAKMIEAAVRKTGCAYALVSGGVASSALLREILPARLARRGCLAEIGWGRPELSGDNAAGVALIGEEMLTEGENYGDSN